MQTLIIGAVACAVVGLVAFIVARMGDLERVKITAALWKLVNLTFELKSRARASNESGRDDQEHS
jgi:hypothetical protein